MASMNFRAGVVAVVRNDADLVLAFERSDVPGQWQLPQGGIDVGETPVQAAWRELQEETALTADHCDLVAEYPEWTVYEWPGTVRAASDGGKRLGQVQRWFTFRLRDASVEPVPDGVEFAAWRWVSADWLVDQVVEFRRAAYRRVLLEAPARTCA